MIPLYLVLALCLFLGVGILCSLRLKVTEYEVPVSGAQGDVRIVFFSDLHCHAHHLRFGEDYEKLVRTVEAQEPDLIVIPGDLINRSSSEIDDKAAGRLIRALTQIAPVYFSYGNHEQDYLADGWSMLPNVVEAYGGHILECAYEDMCINGTRFRLGGMSELAYYGGNGKYDPDAEAFLTDYCDTDIPKVMLSHRPEAFCFKHACYDWDVDLILSGHTHGGMLRLPFIGGVVAPIQGLFPKVDYGEYTFYDTKMIVTSGLAGYEGIPRIYNPSEICVVTLTAKG